MKITLVTNGLTSGGSERVLSLLANALSKKGYETEIVVWVEGEVFYPIEKKVKLTFAEREAGTKSLAKKVVWLRKYLKKNRPDVVIAFLQRVYCVTLLSSIGTGIPVIASERNDPRYFSKFYKALIRIFLPLTTHFVVQTKKIKQYYPQFIRKKTTIIANPVNDKVFAMELPQKREDKIVSVGRLYPQKNQRMLINAFDRIKDKYPTLTLHIYGEGILRKELEKQVEELGLEQRVFLPGRTDKVIEQMNTAKFLCMSSDFEGMSNAMIEAICIGLPIVTTRVSGTDELIEDGKNGYVTPLGDTEALAKAMDRLLADEETIRKFSLYNKGIANRFGSEAVFLQWEEIILGIARPKGKNNGAFSAKERLMASMLNKVPGVKQLAKQIYITIQAVLHRKSYKYKILDDRISAIETPFAEFESFGGYYDRPTIRKNKIVSNISGYSTKNNPSKDRKIKLVVKDLASGEEQFIDTTYAYTWQQGCREQWLDDGRIIYNAFEDGQYRAKVFSLSENKITKQFDLPNQDSYGKDYFLSINYQRIMNLRPDYGYRNLPLLSAEQMNDTVNDGIFKVDYKTGKTELLHSLRTIMECEPKSIFERCHHVANHLMINPAGEGFIFIHRFYEGKRRHDRLMYSDFSTLKVLADEDMVSHCHWIDNKTIIGYLRHGGKDGFYFIDVITGIVRECKAMTEMNLGDGHPSCYGDWITFDTYPDKSRMQHLFLYNVKEDKALPLLEVYHPIRYMNQIRCDLHPRFSDNSKQISFDSVFEGKRMQCVIDVSAITD